MAQLDVVLPADVRSSARVYENGEIAWRREHAERAILALGEAGCLVLGLDFRRDTEEGGTLEVPWSAHDPEGASMADVKLATEHALTALRESLGHEDLVGLPWVLITWTEPG